MRLIGLVLILSVALTLAPLAAAQTPIRIGASLSLTGAYAALGQTRHRGYQLCVKHMNDKGGVLGRKLELVLYDDKSDAATAVRLYEKLIAQDKVELGLGPFSSTIAVPDPRRGYQARRLAGWREDQGCDPETGSEHRLRSLQSRPGRRSRSPTSCYPSSGRTARR